MEDIDQYIRDNARRETEFFKLIEGLEKHNAIFYELMQIGGKPRFSSTFPTACISFGNTGKPLFVFGEEFWDSNDDFTRGWFTIHELLHVLLNHGRRLHRMSVEHKDLHLMDAANIAMDVVIHECIEQYFGLDKHKLPRWEKWCFYDNVFKPEDGVKRNSSFETYFNVLSKRNALVLNGLTKLLLNDHSHLPKGEADKAIAQIGEQLPESEKDKMRKMFNEHSNNTHSGCGNEAGNLMGVISMIDGNHKKKWESVITEWEMKTRTHTKFVSVWTGNDKRLTEMPRDIYLPHWMEMDTQKKDKTTVIFIFDTSGSCYALKDRFFNAAKTLSPKKFNIVLYCFDVRHYLLDIKKPVVFGGGGTSFSALTKIEQEVKAKYKESKGFNYFVLTDGHAAPFTVEKPQDWRVFLTEGGSRKAFPNNMKIYDLSDYA